MIETPQVSKRSKMHPLVRSREIRDKMEELELSLLQSLWLLESEVIRLTKQMQDFQFEIQRLKARIESSCE